MMGDNEGGPVEQPDVAGGGGAPRALLSGPAFYREGYELPVPKDWQAFERLCVELFGRFYNDPNPQPYGRGGQAQDGIDTLIAVDGDPHRLIGIQCKRTDNPLTAEVLRTEIKKTRKLPFSIDTLIFATTAPDDRKGVDALVTVRKEFAGGNDPAIELRTWNDIAKMVYRDEVLYRAYCGNNDADFTSGDAERHGETQAMVREVLIRLDQMQGPIPVSAGLHAPDHAGNDGEDATLHEWIDELQAAVDAGDTTQSLAQRLESMLDKPGVAAAPRARYRLQALLGHVRGRRHEVTTAVAAYEAAYALNPSRPQAIANLALARLMQDDCETAANLAAQSLAASDAPDNASAVIIRLLALARMDWGGDPLEEVPENLVGTAQADLALAEFHRWRQTEGFEDTIAALAARHPEHAELQRVGAFATLARVLEGPDQNQAHDARVAPDELARAGDILLAACEEQLAAERVDDVTLSAQANNTALLLRLCDREQEALDLIERVFDRILPEPHLEHLYASLLGEVGRLDDALAYLATRETPANQLLRAQMLNAQGKDPEAVAILREMGVQDDSLEVQRCRLMAFYSLNAGDHAALDDGIARLVSTGHRALADVLAVCRDVVTTPGDPTRQRAREAIESVPEETPFADRALMAEMLAARELPDAAVQLIEGRVNVASGSREAVQYLRLLSAARRDALFDAELSRLPKPVRESTELRWMVALHAWNTNNPTRVRVELEPLIAMEPHSGMAHLLLSYACARDRDVPAARAVLAAPLEKMDWPSLERECEIVHLLARFDYIDRAAALAYRLYMTHQDEPKAWECLFQLIHGHLLRTPGDERWRLNGVTVQAAVTIRYDNGEQRQFVVEPDPELRAIDQAALEPDQPLVAMLWGASHGHQFEEPGRGRGEVVRVQHKYFERVRTIGSNFEARFHRSDIQSIKMDMDDPEASLAPIEAQVRARADLIARQVEQYRQSPMPLEMLGWAFSGGALEAADVVRKQGRHIAVAGANDYPVSQAHRLLSRPPAGCVLDMMSYWVAWSQETLELIEQLCGPIHLPRAVFDQLQGQLEYLDAQPPGDQLHLEWTATSERLVGVTTEEDQLAAQRSALEGAIAWANKHAVVAHQEMSDAVPAGLRQLVLETPLPVFDSMVLAINHGLLFVSDDARARDLYAAMTHGETICPQVIHLAAVIQGAMTPEPFVRCQADYAAIGSDLSLVSPIDLVTAAALDYADGHAAPGPLIQRLAPVRDHPGRPVNALFHAWFIGMTIDVLWEPGGRFIPSRHLAYRNRVSHHLLEHLVGGRENYGGPLIEAAFRSMRKGNVGALSCAAGWAIGHLLTSDRADSGSRVFATRARGA
ncbi:PIN domain-containing protein [Salinisphaera hydrothermalis]|uniref:PIN domain-containing protein n=1 Tax=Salinisphaera hydrothermalis TaxID=563188 RepID=UPI003342CD0C